MGSETLPNACYILSDESSIPFYSTSNGYKKKPVFQVLQLFPNAYVNWYDLKLSICDEVENFFHCVKRL